MFLEIEFVVDDSGCLKMMYLFVIDPAEISLNQLKSSHENFK
jgi:hypothetical protein